MGNFKVKKTEYDQSSNLLVFIFSVLYSSLEWAYLIYVHSSKQIYIL